MAVLATPNLMGRTGSMGDRRLRRHSGVSRVSCGSIMLGILLASFVMVPYILVGPYVVFSVLRNAQVDISPREEHGSGARSGVRGLSGDRADEKLSRVSTGRLDNLASAGAKPRNAGADAAPGEGDLCLSMAIGISAAQLVTFAASFREVAPVARLVMCFEAPISDRFKDIIDKFDIIPLKIERERLEPAVLRRYHPSSVRWIFIQRFLDIKGSDYERVLMVDAGQTFFQGNPFDIIGDPGIYTFTEDRLIGDSQEHSMKIRNCLGSAALAELADKPAIHSAVSLGTSSFAIGYARQMSEGLVSPAFQACEAAGVDAGLHDYLLHSEGAEGVQTFDQASGLVADVQAATYDMSDSRVVNLSGRVVPMVYRYIGNEALKATVFGRYVYWTEERVPEALPGKNSVPDVRNMAPVASPPVTIADQKKVAPAASPNAVKKCELYSLSEGFDLFKAICDLASRRTRSLSDCCAVCNSNRACQAFSFDKGNGMCYLKNCDKANAPGPATIMKGITSGMKSRQRAG